MKYSIITLLIFLSITGMKSQTVINLWGDKNPPTNNELTSTEEDQKGIVLNVSTSQLIVYKADSLKNNHTAIIICPGGGYTRLAMDHEGHQFAQWLQSQGITGVILKYRMPNKHKEVPLEDFQEAMRYVKANAKEWNVSENKIGVAGFSAGGHLAATASTLAPNDELRPDFSILFYPVITMGEKTHTGSRDNLLGQNIPAKDILMYSNELKIDEFTPPAILLLSDDDKTVVPQNSIMYYDALKNNNIPATMYIFPVGGHGWGMKKDFKYHDEMLILLKKWLEQFSQE